MPHDELENTAALKQDKNGDIKFGSGGFARKEPRDTNDDAVALKGPGGGIEGGEEKDQQKERRSGGVSEGLVSRHRVKLFADGSLGALNVDQCHQKPRTAHAGKRSHACCSSARRVKTNRVSYLVRTHCFDLHGLFTAFPSRMVTFIAFFRCRDGWLYGLRFPLFL